MAGETIDRALGAVLEGLKLSAREHAASQDDPARRRWIAVGLVTALKAALVAALSAYESAVPEDVSDPSAPGRVASVSLLLRRARSAEYLNPPERLELAGSALRAVEDIVAARNEVLHGLGSLPSPDDAVFSQAAGVIRHLCVTHPAFGRDRREVMLALIGDALRDFERRLAGSS